MLISGEDIVTSPKPSTPPPDAPARLPTPAEMDEMACRLPELDSMAVIELVTTIQEKFGFEVDPASITMDTFETIGTLAAFVDSNRPLGEP
jgi:acyl carrier protein